MRAAAIMTNAKGMKPYRALEVLQMIRKFSDLPLGHNDVSAARSAGLQFAEMCISACSKPVLTVCQEPSNASTGAALRAVA